MLLVLNLIGKNIFMKTLALSICGLSMITTSVFAQCEGKIGDIKQSLLPPEQCISEHGKCWRLMDGSPIEDTSLAITLTHLESKLPDARGRFLRGMNHNGEGADPDKNRKAGYSQKDAFQNHTHIIESSKKGTELSGIPGQYDSARGLGKSIRAASASYKNAQSFRLMGARSILGSKEKVRTSSETRPKNIAVYIYAHIGEIIQ